MPLDTAKLDQHIQALRDGSTLTENEVKALCEKVRCVCPMAALKPRLWCCCGFIIILGGLPSCLPAVIWTDHVASPLETPQLTSCIFTLNKNISGKGNFTGREQRSTSQLSGNSLR